MSRPAQSRVVHVELRTLNAAGACLFYRQLFGWRAHAVHVGDGSYIWLELGELIGGGVAEHESAAGSWLPYVEVANLEATLARARSLGAALVLEPREGPTGWRGVIAAADGSEIGLWQTK